MDTSKTRRIAKDSPRYAGSLIARSDFCVRLADVFAELVVHEAADFLDATRPRRLLSWTASGRASLPVDKVPEERGSARRPLLQSQRVLQRDVLLWQGLSEGAKGYS